MHYFNSHCVLSFFAVLTLSSDKNREMILILETLSTRQLSTGRSARAPVAICKWMVPLYDNVPAKRVSDAVFALVFPRICLPLILANSATTGPIKLITMLILSGQPVTDNVFVLLVGRRK